jgi:CRISPR-associated protein Csb1
MAKGAGRVTLEAVRGAVAGSAAAFRCVTRLQPAGGVGDKVFPPTYEGGKYATEKRRLPGREEAVACVLLDSVQSQANRLELALQDAWEDGRASVPVVTVRFPKAGERGMLKHLRVTSLEAPHRVADALLRDGVLVEGKKSTIFRETAAGRALDSADIRNAAGLFEYCPTALVFGIWDSTGPRGGPGVKFQRALVSEIVGVGWEPGVKTSSRIDPAQIMLKAGPIYQAEAGGWTLDEAKAVKGEGKKGTAKALLRGKDGKPSEVNHGNVTPSLSETGGGTIDYAWQTTVLSLPALRRLRFPVEGKGTPERDVAARTALAALGLCAATLARASGCDLRSRCLLVPEEPGAVTWEVIGGADAEPQRLSLEPDDAVALLNEAVAAAKKAGLRWMEQEMVLEPSEELLALVVKSQALAAESGGEGGDA